MKKRLKADPVANTAVASAAFAAKLDAFLQVAVLSSQAQVRELQTLLKARQLFDGKVDGTYSADLRDAIEAYEKAEGLAVTGLATRGAPEAAGRRSRPRGAGQGAAEGQVVAAAIRPGFASRIRLFQKLIQALLLRRRERAASEAAALRADACERARRRRTMAAMSSSSTGADHSSSRVHDSRGRSRTNSP